MTQSDLDCVKQCLNGHPNQFRLLVQRYQAAVLAYLTGQLGSRDRAEEAAQETFVRAYFNLTKLHKPEKFYSWLIGTAHRVAQEHQRNHQKHDQVVRQMMNRKPEAELSENYALERAIGQLPENHRELILLRYYSGLSCRDVAERLATPLGTVTKRLSQAYVMLREFLQADNGREVTP
jgi:RNA polymerase sigma factor (sigma-70 family)